MMPSDGRAFRIVEVSDLFSPLLPEMERVLRELLPQLQPSFREILEGRLDDRGRIKRQIMAALSGDRIAGLLQMFYRPWGDFLLGNADLLGVLESFRRDNIGLNLIQQAVAATMKISAQYKLPAAGVVWLTEPDQGPPDSWADRRVRMFQRLGGQARRDLRYRYDGQPYPDGELIFWFPLAARLADIDTISLAWQLWLFGGLSREQFIDRYGQPGEGDHHFGQIAD
jgi:hypothetical protein